MSVIIPWRDRGRDPLRKANLHRALRHWADFPAPVHVVSDGGSNGDSFNRSRAYNRGAAATDADIIVYAESDLLVDHDQIRDGIELAAAEPGLVVPFSRFMAITPEDSVRVRDHRIDPLDAVADQVRGECGSIGAVNIVSRETIVAIGQWDERFAGAWYDDDAHAHAFATCCGPTRFAAGPGYHLYHLPGASGDHLSDADRAATDRNRRRYERYLGASTPQQIRELTSGVD